MWQLMNVRYVVDKRDLASEGLSLVFEEDKAKVYEMGDPFARAWSAAKTEIISEEEQALARLGADGFDLRQTAILAHPLNTPLADPAASTVQVVDFSPTELTAVVNAAGDHLLVFSQISYPGWQTSVDGQPADLWRVNVVQLGVVVPTGRHTIQLTFWPATFRWGGMISIVAILVWGILIFWPSRQK